MAWPSSPLYHRVLLTCCRRTPEEVQVLVAKSRLLVSRGDSTSAIKLLGEVDPDSPFYVKAK